MLFDFGVYSMAGGITLMAEESRHPEAIPQVLKKPRGVKQGTLEIERWKPSAACRRCGGIGGGAGVVSRFSPGFGASRLCLQGLTADIRFRLPFLGSLEKKDGSPQCGEINRKESKKQVICFRHQNPEKNRTNEK
jgi:hypothetical protein